MAILGKPALRLIKVAFLCLTSGLCCKIIHLIFSRSTSYYHLAEMTWPPDVRDQVALKSILLSHDNKVDSVALLADADGGKKVFMLMSRKDCRLLGSLTDRFPFSDLSVKKIAKERTRLYFPLLACPKLSLPKNLIDRQLTFGFLKPDLVERGLASDALRRIEEKGLTIHAVASTHLSPSLARQFYAEHEGRPFFGELVEYMSSGPVVALIMSGKDGVRRWRELMGPTDPKSAKKVAPKSLRAVFGISTTKNSCHGSDSWESASREIVFACEHLHMEPHSAS